MKICTQCQSQFQPRRLHQVFCSKRCRIKANRTVYNQRKKKPVVTLTCEWCQESFETNLSRQRFCRQDCQNHSFQANNKKPKKPRKIVRAPKGMKAIYYLRDKETLEVRYIGTTGNPFSQRLGQHKSSGRPIPGVPEWLESTDVEIVPVCFVSDDLALCYEALAIQAAREAGWRLFNGERNEHRHIVGKEPECTEGILRVCRGCHRDFFILNKPGQPRKYCTDCRPTFLTEPCPLIPDP